MKTYIKTTWNWFRLLALGSILVCTHALKANAAETPLVKWDPLEAITYGTPLGATQLSAAALDPVSLVTLPGTPTYRLVANSSLVVAGTVLDANATGWAIQFEFVPSNPAYSTVTAVNTLKVNRLALTFTADNKERSFGEPNPTFTGTWSPSAPLLSDAISAITTCSATPSSPVTVAPNLYTIQVNTTPNDRQANYIFTLNNASLKVNPATLTITATSVNNLYGDKNYITSTAGTAFTVSLPDSLTYRDDLANLNVTVDLFTTSTNYVPTNWPPAGTYMYRVTSVTSKAASAGIPAAGANVYNYAWAAAGNRTITSATPNYTPVVVDGVLTVGKRPLKLTAFDQTWEYGDFRDFTGTIEGLVKVPYIDTLPTSGVRSAGPTNGFDDSTNLVITWLSLSSNAPPAVYNVTPNVTERTDLPGRLFNNYSPVTTIAGNLTITKRRPDVEWIIPPADQTITYGDLVGAKQKTAKFVNLLDAAIYQQPPTAAPTYDITGEPLNVGFGVPIVAVSGESTFYAYSRYTNLITIKPFNPVLTWAKEVTADGARKGFIDDMAYGTPLSSVQLAVTAAGSSTAGATAPGPLVYNFLPGDILAPRTGDATPHYVLSASTVANQNYSQVQRDVKLVVTNGVFDIASPSLANMQATPAVGPAVDFSFTGVAKVGDPAKAAADKLTIVSGKYWDNAVFGGTPAKVHAVLVNTNGDAAGQKVTFAPIEPKANGEFVINDPTLPSYLQIDPTTFYPGKAFVQGTNFELQVSYTNAYVQYVAGDPSKIAQGVLSVTNKYKVTVGKLNTVIVADSQTPVYGSLSQIVVPVAAKFTAGNGSLHNKTLSVLFNGVTSSLTLSRDTATANPTLFTNTFVLDLVTTNPVTLVVTDIRTNFASFYGPFPMKFTLAEDPAAYNGSEKTVTINFKRRDLHVRAFTGDAATVVYGENSDAPATYSYKTYASAAVPAPNTLSTPGDFTSEMVYGDKVKAPTILPPILTPATQAGAPVTVLVGTPDFSGADPRAVLNYNVIPVNGNLTILRRQLSLQVEDKTFATNEDHAGKLSYKIDGWVDAGDAKSRLKAAGVGKIELSTVRKLDAPVNSTWVITNAWGNGASAAIDRLILTNYSETTNTYPAYNPGNFTNQFSFWIDGPLGTNYFVKTTKPSGTLSVSGVLPTYTWSPNDMTYGQVFGTNNIINALVYTNALGKTPTLDTNLANYAYSAVQNDVSGGDYTQVWADKGLYRYPMATTSLKVKLVYTPPVASQNDVASLTVEKTIKVNKSTLFVFLSQTAGIAYGDVLPGDYKIGITYNGIATTGASADPITGGARAIFARVPAITADFINSVILTNSGTMKTPVGKYVVAATAQNADKGWSFSSNYIVQFFQGTYEVTGTVVTGGPSWKEETDDAKNIIKTYGWRYSKTTLVQNFKDAIVPSGGTPLSIDDTRVAPEANLSIADWAKQFTITINGNAYNDGDLLNAQTNKILYIYQPSAAYSPINYTNRIQIRPYVIRMVLKWDAAIGSQTSRAYQDDVNLFPVLWDASGTNFGTNIAGPYTNMLSFDVPGNASWKIPNGDSPLTFRWLTNSLNMPTNLYFADTNETLSDLGLFVVGPTPEQPSLPGPNGIQYPIVFGYKKVSAYNNYGVLVLNGSGAPYPATAPTINVTNAILKFVVDPMSRAYGSANPTFTGSILAYKSDGKTSYANKDSISMLLTNYSTTNSVVGQYPITIYSQVDPNQKIQYYNPDTVSSGQAWLTVTGALLTATARDARLRPGQPKPAFVTDSLTGFVNNETTNLVTAWPTWDSSYSSGAVIGSTFAITNKTAGAAPNYSFKYVNGTVTVAANIPPTARNDSATVIQSAPGSKILIQKLLANDSSIFGDKLTFVASEFPKLSARGITVVADDFGLWLYYNTEGKTLDLTGYDTFTYSVLDSVGGKGTATVFVKVSIPNPAYRPSNQKSMTLNQDTGELTIEFVGLNARRYKVQGSTTLGASAVWTDLQLYDRSTFPDLTVAGVVTTNIFNCSNSVIRVTDPAGVSAGGQFYRCIVN